MQAFPQVNKKERSLFSHFALFWQKIWPAKRLARLEDVQKRPSTASRLIYSCEKSISNKELSPLISHQSSSNRQNIAAP